MYRAERVNFMKASKCTITYQRLHTIKMYISITNRTKYNVMHLMRQRNDVVSTKHIVGLISKPRIWTFFRKALFYMAGFSVAMRTFCQNDVPLRQS